MRRGQSREPGFPLHHRRQRGHRWETVLIDNIAAPGGNHNGGDLQFDRNGLLYVSVGDGAQPPRRRDRSPR